jgi:hypothetical protein
MGTVRFPDNVTIAGALSAESINFPAGTISDSAISGTAGIDADKLEHKHRKTYAQSGTATSVTIPIHLVVGATARRLICSAGSIAIAIGDSTVTIDLKKAGSSVLSGVTTLDSSNTARTAESLAVTTSTAVAGNLYELVIVATIGTGTLPTGLFVEFEIDEVA